MAKRYITSLLSDKLGAYLDGLDKTDIKFSLSDAILEMENVSFKEEALKNLKLPIQIKHGLIRRLDVRVPWRTISSSPVSITFEGIDLLVTPKMSESWEFPDIFSPEHLEKQLLYMIQVAMTQEQSDSQNSYLDSFKLKVMDNIKINIKEVHIRVEHMVFADRLHERESKQSSFGILIRKFEIRTTDKDGKEIFHDRTQSKQDIIKRVALEGLAVYLNPHDTAMIHRLPNKALQKRLEVSDQMRVCIQRYIELTDQQMKGGEDADRVVDDPNLIYILRPLSLRVIVQRSVEKPEKLTVDITLDQFSLQFLYNQLNAILVFSKLASRYQQKAGEQEKQRQYKFLRQPFMNAKQRWKFAIECICRSIRTKKGALTAFAIQPSKLKEIEKLFKPMLLQYYQAGEGLQREQLLNKYWNSQASAFFWQTLASVPAQQVQSWINEIVQPLLKQKQLEQQAQSKKQSWLGWMMGSAQQQEEDEDDLDEFFDCEEIEPNARETTSLYVHFEVKENTLLLAKLINQSKLEGIQMHNKGATIELKAPNLKMDQFHCEINFQETGVELVTIDRQTGKYTEYTQAISQNKQSVEGQSERPQLTMEVRKGDTNLLKDSIEYDINLQVSSVIYKHYEDLIIRARAISNIKIDQEIQTAAMGTFEDLRESTQNRLHEMLYKKKNRYCISIESPVLIIPLNQTFEGKNAPVWIIKLGNMLILSEKDKKQVVAQKIVTKLVQKPATADVYDGYKVTLSSMGLHYYQSYRIYQKSLVKSQSGFVYQGQNVAQMPQRFHEFSLEQQANFNQTKPSQTMRDFTVLEDYQINMSVRLLKKQKDRITNAPQLDLEVATTPIKINLHHDLYNQLVNFSHIFKISKEKAKQFTDESDSYNAKVKEEIQLNKVFESQVKRLIQDTMVWQDVHAVLSGRYLYYFESRQALTYLEYLDIKDAVITLNEPQLTIETRDREHKCSFITREVKSQAWETALKQQIFQIHAQEMNDYNQVQVERKKNILKRSINNPEQPSAKMSFTVPSLKIQLMRLILMSGTKTVLLPAAFEPWVCIEFQGMQMTQTTREFDSEQQIKFQQICLVDVMMPSCHQTLISQTQDGQSSLQLVLSKFKEQSPNFKGVLYDVAVTLINVNFKFMPGSINQIIKLLRSTKLQATPHRLNDDPEPNRDYIEQNSSSSDHDSQLLLPERETDKQQLLVARQTFDLSPEQQKFVEKAQPVQKFFDGTCLEKTVQSSSMRCSIRNFNCTMLHHKYTMPLFSLETESMDVEMAEWYDHSHFKCKMKAVRLCDLSNHPYTQSPKAYYEIVCGNGQPQPTKIQEMIRSDDFEFLMQSYQQDKCALKNKDYNNKLVMRISPFRINYVQEVTMRFVEYFQQRFIDSLVMTDPYQDPKQEFLDRQNRKGIPLNKLDLNTDFKQPKLVDFMDIQIAKAEIYARDRPFSQNYILISSPMIKVSSERLLVSNRIKEKPDIKLSMQRYRIQLQTINFWYGISKHRKDKLSLLKKTFGIKINFDALQYSELLEKIDVRDMDKSTNVQIDFDPVMLVLPQAVYTFMLRCSDLNFTWSDRLQAEFYCVKWIHMQDYYKQLKKVISQVVNIRIPLLSLTLKHTDGSFISELLMRTFTHSMTRYMDGASYQAIRCSKFMILDQQSNMKTTKKQAIVCPWASPMLIDPNLLLEKLTESELSEDDQLKIFVDMKPSGDRTIHIEIQGLKIFMKLPLFMLLQGFFVNAFPSYRQDDVDKPIGFQGNDPDNTSKMDMYLKINKSLICVLNQPGYKSIAMQGEIEFTTKQENINKIKKQLGQGQDRVYAMEFQVKQLTPFICSLSHLESGSIDFTEINKRQLFSPLDMAYKQQLMLSECVDDKQRTEVGKWGVISQQDIKIGQLQLRLSMLDLHLILQVTAYASEQMAKETVYRLQEIERSIDQEFIQKMQTDELVGGNHSSKASKLLGSETQDRQSQFFEQLLVKFQESNSDSVATVMERLSQTTTQFKKLVQGYTGQSYNERQTFLQFVTQDILQQDSAQLLNFSVASKVQHTTVEHQIEELSDEDDDDDDNAKEEQNDELLDITEGNTSYYTLIRSERKKSIAEAFQRLKGSVNSKPNTAQTSPSQKLLQTRSQGSISFKQSSRKSLQQSSPKNSSQQSEDDEDEFHSARGSFESYRDQVETAVDVFYSFHEKKTASEARKLDNPEMTLKSNYMSAVGEVIRETTGEEREYIEQPSSSEDSSPEEAALIQAQPSQPIEEPEIKSTMQNVIEDIKEIQCETISILAINDYNCGFTPVLQLEFGRVMMSQSWTQQQTNVNLVMSDILCNYYNIELGEWEPLLEPTKMEVQQQTTQIVQNVIVNMLQPINLNSTQECLQNIFYTYESWMKTPQFFQKPDKKKLTKSQINQSEPGDSDDDQFNPNNRMINQLRESIVKQRPFSANKLQQIQASRFSEEQPFSEEQDSKIVTNNYQTVTPFSIANHTSRLIKIVRGGIKEPEFFQEVKQHMQRGFDGRPEKQPIYILDPGTQLDYAVTYERLMGNQTVKHKDESSVNIEMQIDSSDVSQSAAVNEEDQVNQRKNEKIKTNEMVGIQLSELDYVPYVDLNRNTGQNPWVHEISASLNKQQQKSKPTPKANSNPHDNEVPLLQEADFELVIDNADVLPSNTIRNKVFYGTLLKGMRKFLIVRQPYCFLNKTSFKYELRIIESASGGKLKFQHELKSSESLGIDDSYLLGHYLQIKLLDKDADQYDGMDERGWSEKVYISTLLKLPTNEGTGHFLSTIDQPFLTTCIKRQSGQINGTVDLALLPPLTIKNCLPCALNIKRKNNGSQQFETYQLDESQEKQLHFFAPNKLTQTIDVQIGIDQYQLVDVELKLGQHTAAEEDFEVMDRNGSTLRIGLRKKYTDAGFQLIFFAHVVILIETFQVLPLMQIYYKSNFREPRILTNQDEMRQRKFVMCNKDCDIAIGIKNQVAANVNTYSFSQQLNLTKVGESTPVSVNTQPPEPLRPIRFEFVCTPTMQLANNEENIYTKVVQISPTYVICNFTSQPLEVAQADNIDALSEGERILRVNEKREWYWPVGDHPNLKIIMRKLSASAYRVFQAALQEDGQQKQLTEVDRVREWMWSKPISLQIQDQIAFPIVICEFNGQRKKILKIGRKVVGATTFIIIREEIETQQPIFQIRNNCPNLRLQFWQDGFATPTLWKLQEMQSTSYAHLDPQSRTQTVSFTLVIDKSQRGWKFKDSQCFEVLKPNKSFEGEMTETYSYMDLSNKERQIQMHVTNDGISKTITFSLLGESIKKVRTMPQSQPSQSPTTLQRSLIRVQLSLLSISIIGYTQQIIQNNSQQQQVRRERNEIALITVSDMSLQNSHNLVTNSQETKLNIIKFQVDNQSSLNPLFPTILQKKNTAQDAAPFLYFNFRRQFNKETNINTIEDFHLQMAEYSLRVDDLFLVSLFDTIASAQAIAQSSGQYVHPLFMKDGFYGKAGYFNLYVSDADLATVRTSEQRHTYAINTLQEKRKVAKNPPTGLVLVNEVKFNQRLDEVPTQFRHWMMQDRELEESAKLEIRQFKIGAIVLDLTVIFRTNSRKENQGALSYFQQAGMQLASIDELILTFLPYEKENRFVAEIDFSQNIYDFYYKYAMSKILIGMLSMKFIGSIPQTARHIYTGLVDFVDHPRRGYQRSWYAGVGGVFTGSWSVLKNFSIGMLGISQNIGESWSELMLAVCMDKDYAVQHEEEVITERPKNFVEGLGYGARSALWSIADGISGLIRRPVLEAYRGGAKGLGFGIYQGITGIFLKPSSGALDLLAKTSEGIKNTFRIFDQKQKGRVRMPRTFYGIQRRIKAFSELDAFIVSNVLCQIKRGEFANDHYIDMKLIKTSSDNRAPHFLLLSEENLFLIEASQKAIVWHIEQKHIIKYQNMSNGLLINLNEQEDYAGRAQVGLPLDGQSSEEINEWFAQIITDQF